MHFRLHPLTSNIHLLINRKWLFKHCHIDNDNAVIVDTITNGNNTKPTLSEKPQTSTTQSNNRQRQKSMNVINVLEWWWFVTDIYKVLLFVLLNNEIYLEEKIYVCIKTNRWIHGHGHWNCDILFRTIWIRYVRKWASEKRMICLHFSFIS